MKAPATLLSLVLGMSMIASCGDAAPDGKKDASKKASEKKDAEASASEKTPDAKAEGADAPAAEEAEAEVDAGEPAPEPAKAAPSLDELGEVGIAECDAYVGKYRACIQDKVPDDQKAAHTKTLADEVAAWVQTKNGGGENAQSALVLGCKAAEAGAKAKTESFGCAWE